MSATQTFVLNANDDGRERVLDQCTGFLGRLPKAKAWKVEITPYSKPRSLDQNAAAYGLAEKTLMEFIGERGEAAKKRLHEDLCCGYFGEVKTLTGRKPKRTTTTDEFGERKVLDAKEFADFYEFIVQTAAEIGCFIPDPDPTKARALRGRFEQ
jgi:hypothetical protein